MASPRGRRAPARPAGVAVGRRPRRSATRRELAEARSLGPLLEQWFEKNGREFPWRRWRDPYRVAVTEVLLQRTRAEVVTRFIPHFFERFPGWGALAAAEPGDLENELEVLGLQKRRAMSLLALARSMRGSADLPGDTAPGVGQYIDRAVRVAINGEAVAMVDANFVRIVRRVFSGVWMSDYRYDPRLQGLALTMVEGAKDPRTANWAVLDIGAGTCTPTSPRCDQCPLRGACRYRKGGGS